MEAKNVVAITKTDGSLINPNDRCEFTDIDTWGIHMRTHYASGMIEGVIRWSEIRNLYLSSRKVRLTESGTARTLDAKVGQEMHVLDNSMTASPHPLLVEVRPEADTVALWQLGEGDYEEIDFVKSGFGNGGLFASTPRVSKGQYVSRESRL
jgi:hypothetical protein